MTNGGALLADADLVVAEQADVDGFDAFLDARRDPSNSKLRADVDRLYGGLDLQ